MITVLLKLLAAAVSAMLFVFSSGHWAGDRFGRSIPVRFAAGLLAVLLAYLALEPFLPVPKLETIITKSVRPEPMKDREIAENSPRSSNGSPSSERKSPSIAPQSPTTAAQRPTTAAQRPTTAAQSPSTISVSSKPPLSDLPAPVRGDGKTDFGGRPITDTQAPIRSFVGTGAGLLDYACIAKRAGADNDKQPATSARSLTYLPGLNGGSFEAVLGGRLVKLVNLRAASTTLKASVRTIIFDKYKPSDRRAMVNDIGLAEVHVGPKGILFRVSFMHAWPLRCIDLVFSPENAGRITYGHLYYDKGNAVFGVELMPMRETKSPYGMTNDNNFCKYALRRAKKLAIVQEQARVYQGAWSDGASTKYYRCNVENNGGSRDRLYVDLGCATTFEDGWNSSNWDHSCLKVSEDRPDVSAVHVGVLGSDESRNPYVQVRIPTQAKVGDVVFCFDDADARVRMQVTRFGRGPGRMSMVRYEHPKFEWAEVKLLGASMTTCSMGQTVYKD